ncbi:MAG: glycosyltransferase family 4 protein [Candidatus Rokubacteria bacterium]|nr:glycosyltransferase family 4 protein [Candidatus Rokubacteria bacterium]
MAAALRILQLYPKSDYFTGAAIQLRDLALGLAERGHRVTVATPPSPPWARRLAGTPVEHAVIPMRRAWDPRAVWRLARLLHARDIQVVHAHKGRARTLAWLAGLLGPRPVLVLNRGVSFRPTALSRIGYTSRRVHAIVAVCESIKRGLVAAGVPAGKIEVIYSGTDTARFHPGVDGTRVRRELGLGAAHFLVTQIGVRSWRGWSDLLDAMVPVARRVETARLLFVGAPPPRVAELGERARARGLGDRVLVLGHREDIPEILAASDLVADASYAGLGITGSIREALACERPVVATRVEGMPELVLAGETGVLVPPRQPPALAEAILALHENPTRRQELARAGRKRVETHFSLRAKIDATDALYRRLVAAGGSA